MARHGNDDSRAHTEEVARYRRAAEEALNQLDWCVDYLHRIRKNRIAQVISNNRSLIRREMTRTDE